LLVAGATMRTISLAASPGNPGPRVTHIRRPDGLGTPSGDKTLIAQLLRDHQLALEQLLKQQQQHLERLLAKQGSEGDRSSFVTDTAESSNTDKSVRIVRVESQRTEAERPLINLHRHASSVSSDDSDTEMPARHSSGVFVPRNCLQEHLLPIVKSWLFQGIMSSIILANALFLAVTTHCKVIAELEGNPIKPATQNIFDMFKWFFFLVFVIEMVIRLLAEQMQFCSRENVGWNLFELVCVASMSVEVFHLENHAELFGNLTTLRILRMLRILRAARALRLFQFFKPLRLMLYSVVSCLVSMMWALVLIIITAAIAALYLEDSALGYLQVPCCSGNSPCLSDNSTVQEGAICKEVRQSLEENWNGMWVAIRSLIYAISGGADWGDLAAPFWQMGPFPGFLFGVYVLVSTLGLLNVLVGIFVQEASELANWDNDLLVDGIVEKKEKHAREIKALFDSIDLEKTGWLSLEDLSTSLENPRISAFFEHLDVDVSKVEVLFKLLDFDGNGKITKDEFVTGIAQLQGKGNPEDVASRLVEEKKLHAKIDDLRDMVSRHYGTVMQIR